MKKQWRFPVTLLFLTTVWLTAFGQEDLKNVSGTWKGLFWSEYETVLQLDLSGEGLPSGTIQMFDENTQIQDDALARIRLEHHRLFFYIPAKDTEFEGTLDGQFSLIEGTFIFPDGSKHSFKAEKVQS